MAFNYNVTFIKLGQKKEYPWAQYNDKKRPYGGAQGWS